MQTVLNLKPQTICQVVAQMQNVCQVSMCGTISASMVVYNDICVQSVKSGNFWYMLKIQNSPGTQ